MRVLERGIWADLLRICRRDKDDPNGKYDYAVQIHNYEVTPEPIPCTNFTGAAILMDVLNRVMPAPTLVEKS